MPDSLQKRLQSKVNKIGIELMHAPPYLCHKTNTMEWIEKLNGNVIVSDAGSKVIYMNEKAIRQYEKEGGAALIGQDLLACHNEESKKKIREIMATGQANVYTIEKKGVKKLIYQSPWYQDGEFRGIVEFSLEIPAEMPHYIRG